MRIDFISDVACPWCAIGLASLEQALAALGPEAAGIELHFQPFELNPQMPPEGADAAQYLKAKYGLGDAQLAANRENIRARGAALGFTFGERAHVWNTFDAHRLLHWAGLQGPAPQRALKRALLKAYHGEGRNPAAREVLLEAAAAAGLDASEAAAVIDDRDCFAPEVREAEAEWQQAGIRSVPSVVLDRRFLIQGGQPPEVFEDALRRRLAATD
ncbi:MAG: DsbA family oxidoreductase [Betaproteobacteria bacterium]|jgi:predicted DsbA family dithiol-disulfide isomerase|nr:DsbA family oxidoreductase [Rubrivivax sp.]